jgi:hypothetical protein
VQTSPYSDIIKYTEKTRNPIAYHTLQNTSHISKQKQKRKKYRAKGRRRTIRRGEFLDSPKHKGNSTELKKSYTKTTKKKKKKTRLHRGI